MWLTFIAIRNAIGILMASLAIVVLGATSLHRMPIDLFPNINLPVLTIGTIYTGANVQDIEKTVTYPIEKAVSAVANVEHVESKSRQGVSAVQVWFNFDADINAGQNEVMTLNPTVSKRSRASNTDWMSSSASSRVTTRPGWSRPLATRLSSSG